MNVEKYLWALLAWGIFCFVVLPIGVPIVDKHYQEIRKEKALENAARYNRGYRKQLPQVKL